MNLTKDNFFLDTNVIIYLFDKTQPRKQEISKNLLKEALVSNRGYVSFQVIQEFCNAALRKFENPLSVEDCKEFIQKFLYPVCAEFPGLELYQLALDLKKKTMYSFYDALIIASALNCGCRVLYSEDLKHGQQISDLIIVNPYYPGSSQD